MLYGAGASPRNIACHVELSKGFLNNSTASSSLTVVPEVVGMCFMTPVCDLNEQITCHRYEAKVKNNVKDKSILILPERISSGSNYRLYSSIFDGAVIDSKL
jgi:hypothetical protein